MSLPHVVIVTGAAGGIGNAIVRNLVENHGASVVATDIVEGSLGTQKTLFGDKLEVVIGDISDVCQKSPPPLHTLSQSFLPSGFCLAGMFYLTA